MIPSESDREEKKVQRYLGDDGGNYQTMMLD